MANNLNLPIHIEFYGLPGSGKSTISHIIAEKLKKKGYNVYEPSFQMDHNNLPVIRKLKKMFTCIKYLIFHISNFKKIYKIAEENNYRGKEAIKQIINIIPKIEIYSKAESNCIYIWDEGLVQSAISLSSFNDRNSNDNAVKLFNLIENKNFIIKKVYIQEKVVICLQRIEQRQTNDSRVEKANKEQKINMLNKIDNCCNNIDKKDGIVIADKEIDSKINTIVNYIKRIKE